MNARQHIVTNITASMSPLQPLTSLPECERQAASCLLGSRSWAAKCTALLALYLDLSLHPLQPCTHVHIVLHALQLVQPGLLPTCISTALCACHRLV